MDDVDKSGALFPAGKVLGEKNRKDQQHIFYAHVSTWSKAGNLLLFYFFRDFLNNPAYSTSGLNRSLSLPPEGTVYQLSYKLHYRFNPF
ncbi:hypothetical protein D770_10570 [Flammeovirgaceae bacterium 311]|nr:hypothetical protein D770_10570 [Flammeovirgaceae bacterium 311]